MILDTSLTQLLKVGEGEGVAQPNLKVCWVHPIPLSTFSGLGHDYPSVFTAPIRAFLEGMLFFRLFLDQVRETLGIAKTTVAFLTPQIFNGLVMVLVGLGILMIYSLLLADTEGKTYEYGMLRALGLEQRALVTVLFLQVGFASCLRVVSSVLLWHYYL